MNCVTVQLVLTLTSPNHRPRQIHKTLTIQLGRNLDGSAMPPLTLYPGTNNVGVLEVDIELPGIVALAPQSPRVQVSTSHVAPDGTLKTSQTDSLLLPKSQVYSNLELLAVEYTSEKTTCEACGALLEPGRTRELMNDHELLCHECHGARGIPF